MNQSSQRPILCGTDFSGSAAKAADVAAAMAMRLGAPLLLAHGIDEHGEIPASYWPSLESALRAQLHTEAGRVRRTGAQVEEIMAGGAPEDGVASRAERADARCIVLGSNGHGTVGRMILGSVSESIAESAWVPTLVLRESARIEDWARGGKPLRVFVGADFTANSDTAMTWAASLREIGPCEFTIGFVDLAADRRTSELEDAPARTPPPEEVHEMLLHDLRERTASYFQKDAIHVRVLPTKGRVDSHLLEMAGEANAELIVIGTHQWQGLRRLRHPSVSRRILHAAQTNVACVPSRRPVSANSTCISQAHRILVATGLSSHDGSAVPYAFSTLQPGGTAWLLHVAQPSEIAALQLPRLREMIPAEAIERGFKVQTEVVSDADVAKAICDAAERLDVDLICIGSRGPCKRIDALGDTTLAVLARSTRPVLIVPQKAS
jgi:nucleotide-binding universal stress UspA family protein